MRIAAFAIASLILSLPASAQQFTDALFCQVMQDTAAKGMPNNNRYLFRGLMV
jgi:hypothetical protein